MFRYPSWIGQLFGQQQQQRRKLAVDNNKSPTSWCFPWQQRRKLRQGQVTNHSVNLKGSHNNKSLACWKCFGGFYFLLLLLLVCRSTWIVITSSSLSSPPMSHDVSADSQDGTEDLEENGKEIKAVVLRPSRDKASSTECAANIDIQNHTVRLTERPCQPITVAYAISLIKCGDLQSTPEGLVDASLVLRHSIHKISIRAGLDVSAYDYKMYAIVHKDAEQCSHVLKEAGFTILIKSPPLEVKEIRGDFLRKTIHKEVCCGHDEFIKLYAYTFLEPIVVHVDIDFIFHKPMDNLFDALLYHKDSKIGSSARTRIERERPTDVWPEEPQVFMTRDWPQVFPGRKAAYQAGFIALRPNPKILEEMVEIVKEGDFIEGNQRENGWGGKGYGGFVGARAMQGLVAYYYDQYAPETWVELNQCRYNHMGIDTKFNPGGFGYRSSERGQCRNRIGDCEDCMSTNHTMIYSIHYTKCRKPWSCIGEGDSTLSKDTMSVTSFRAASKKLIPEQIVRLDHCLELLQVWHSVRSDLENELQQLVQATGEKNDDNQTFSIEKGRSGSYKAPFFQGHCANQRGYLSLASGHNETLRRIPELYNKIY